MVCIRQLSTTLAGLPRKSASIKDRFVSGLGFRSLFILTRCVERRSVHFMVVGRRKERERTGPTSQYPFPRNHPCPQRRQLDPSSLSNECPSLGTKFSAWGHSGSSPQHWWKDKWVCLSCQVNGEKGRSLSLRRGGHVPPPALTPTSKEVSLGELRKLKLRNRKGENYTPELKGWQMALGGIAKWK